MEGNERGKLIFSQGADVSAYLKQRSLVFLFRKPSEVDTFETILWPLRGRTWAAAVATVAAFFIFLYTMSKADGTTDWKNSRTYHVASVSVVTLINEALPPEWFMVSQKFNRTVW